MNITCGKYILKDPNKLNILVGKNGCGKSSLLRAINSVLIRDNPEWSKVGYITPERGGVLQRNASIDQNSINDPNSISQSRLVNQLTQFKQQTVTHYAKLETLVLREVDKMSREEIVEDKYHFGHYVSKINKLLDNIEIREGGDQFKIYKKGEETVVPPEHISSGESELISLAIECLVFNKESIEGNKSLLLLDEPDVHLHPDLQARFASFLIELINEGKIHIIIATHSTAFIGGLEDSGNTSIEFMRAGQTEIDFKEISSIYKKILPVFGAHPLSNIFNESPILLVEGEDDERMWQFLIRSSKGTIKLFPCECGTISKMNDYEKEVLKIINSVYDNGVGFSLRDKDESPEFIEDLPPIIRMRLSCRNAENLILTDEVLNYLGTDWERLTELINKWILVNSKDSNPKFDDVVAFRDLGFDRKMHDIKEIRNVLLGIIGTSKTWELAVGKSIALTIENVVPLHFEENHLLNYLGDKVCKYLLNIRQSV